MITQFGQKFIKIILYLVGAAVAKKALSLVVKRLRRIPGKISQKVSAQQRQRIATLRRLILNSAKIIINFIVLMMILAELGVNIAPLLTGAGILGLAVGFGAKSLVADVIEGFFIILENQFNVGDEVQIGSYQGHVSRISLRTVILKDKEKKTYIIPNSTIKAVIKLPQKD